ncbi:hypothetical protein [Mucilaginibacter sp. HD30]
MEIMKAFCFLTATVLMPLLTFAQQLVIDVQHFVAVSENAAVRTGAEATHEQYLSKINHNIDNLNTNMGSVVLAQSMICQALSNVNSALKNGLEVKYMAVIIGDMGNYMAQAMEMAREEPWLLLFAEKISAEMRAKSLALVNDVSGYILKEGSNILSDYNSRDQLLHDVTRRLQVLNGLAYGAWKAMYWARQRGIIAALNPFQNYINRDKAIVAQIIQNARYLRE